MPLVRIVHLIATLNHAGPARSLVAYARAAGEQGARHAHCLLVLSTQIHPAMLVAAKRCGFEVRVNPDRGDIREAIAAADIALLHYWNSPAINDVLYGGLPECRLVIWYRVFGRHSPHAITRAQLDRADAVFVTSEGSRKLPVFAEHPRRPVFAPGIADFERLHDVSPRPHRHFNVTYIGTVNPGKMHPRFVEMSRRIGIPDLRIVVCGSGGDDAFREVMAVDDRFEYRGFVNSIGEVLSETDVFGYPLCPETYATSEQSVQEAMWAGVPPVVFPHAGLASLVTDGETGRVVRSEAEYVDAVEALYRDPDERSRLGVNAREYARTQFDIDRHARRVLRACESIGDAPRTAKPALPIGPAERFLASLEPSTAELLSTVAAAPDQNVLAELDRQRPFHFLMTHGEGGVIHYRNHYPDVPEFRLWTALALRTSKPDTARRELRAAEAAGLAVGGLVETFTG